jgi:RES domain-containing protein
LIITSWRLVGEQYATRAFEGEGARRAGGRWNSSGRPAVYTAATTSLALLETLVHADLDLAPLYLTFPVTFDSDFVESISLEQLPPAWNAVPVPRLSRRIGDEWIDSQRSCVLEVPSVVVPHESNFVLNPRHPDFGSIEIGEPVEIEMDSRLG